MPFDQKYKCIGRGLAGWHAKADDCSSSGGDLKSYLEKAEEGCLVYDAEEADERAFIKHVLEGPMLDTKLPLGSEDRIDDAFRERAAKMLKGLGGGFKTLVARAIIDKGYTGLDSVSIDIYEYILRTIPGIKIGHVKDGKVVWE